MTGFLGWDERCDSSTTVYVLGESLRVDVGFGSASPIDVLPGDFIYIPGDLRDGVRPRLRLV